MITELESAIEAEVEEPKSDDELLQQAKWKSLTKLVDQKGNKLVAETGVKMLSSGVPLDLVAGRSDVGSVPGPGGVGGSGMTGAGGAAGPGSTVTVTSQGMNSRIRAAASAGTAFTGLQTAKTSSSTQKNLGLLSTKPEPLAEDEQTPGLIKKTEREIIKMVTPKQGRRDCFHLLSHMTLTTGISTTALQVVHVQNRTLLMVDDMTVFHL